MPDDELLDAAAGGELSDPAELGRQVRRMLADDRARALTDNFVGQWLQLRNLEAARPSQVLFADFDDGLRRAFRRETELFFESVVREDRSVLDLLDADYRSSTTGSRGTTAFPTCRAATSGGWG